MKCGAAISDRPAVLPLASMRYERRCDGEKPKAPVMLHYGARDPGIPRENIERVRAATPGSPLYLYDAGHGFCRAGGHDFNPEAAALAIERTLNWFARWRV